MKDQDNQPGWPLAKQALSHPERSEMLACITRKGTADAAELAAALGLSTAKTRYHLLVLYRAALIDQIEADGRYAAILGL